MMTKAEWHELSRRNGMVTIPKHTNVIEDSAMSWSRAEVVLLHDNIESIGKDAFYMANIKHIKIPEKVKVYAGAFNKSQLEEVEIKSEIISKSVFADCQQLKSVKLECTKEIKEFAFQKSGIESIYIPNSVVRIEDKVFAGCPNLKEVHLPEGLNKIGNQLFNQCDNLKTVNIPDTIERIGMKAFAGTAIEQFIMPDSVTKIGNRVFYNCKDLKRIKISKNLQIFPFDFLENCTCLEEIEMDNKFLLSISVYSWIPTTIQSLKIGDFYIVNKTGVWQVDYERSKKSVMQDYFDSIDAIAQNSSIGFVLNVIKNYIQICK